MSYPTQTRNSTTLFREIASSAPIDQDKPIVLYDNLHQGAAAGSDEHAAFERGCIYLSPADIISVNLNMTYLFHAPARHSKDIIGDLIYANIELKKMIEKYEDIQEKAVEIAALSNSPEFLKSPYAIYMPSLQKFINEKLWKPSTGEEGRGIEKGAASEKMQSLASQQTRVENFINRSVSTTNFSLSAAAPSPVMRKGTDSTPDAIVNPKPSLLPAGAIAPPEKFINIARSSAGRQHFTSGMASPKPMSEKSSASDRKQPDRKIEPVSPGELPWWISAPSEFISYCMNNKIEAGIMLLFLIFFLNILGAIFRR